MIRAAAVVPHPPLLVRGLGGRSDPLAELRERCLEAVAALGGGPVVLVGDGPETRPYDPRPADLTPYGLPRSSRPGAANASQNARSTPHTVSTGLPPLSLAVGAWLCERAGVRPLAAYAVAPGAGADPELDDGVALLTLADGSAARGEKAPAGPHPGAQASDDALAAALATGDAAALAAYDPDPLLQATGAPALRTLGRLAAGAAWHARLVTHEAPFGVAYLVAHWTRET